MKDIEEHIDDLFRRAAENYLPKPGENNWDSIAMELEKSVEISTPEKKAYRKRKYVLTTILLFLCLTAGIGTYRYNTNDKANIFPVAENKEPYTERNEHFEHKDPLHSLEHQEFQPIKESHQRDQLKEIGNRLFELQYDIHKNDIYNIDGKSNPVTYSKADELYSINDFSLATIHARPSTIISLSMLEKPILNMRVPNINLAPVNDSSSVDLTVKSPKFSGKGMYYGVVTGFGFARIKNQDFSKGCFDIGLVAGYRLSPRSAIEINILYAQKNYYSSGRYFNMDKIKQDMPSDMEVVSIKGRSNVFEIPVKFKYNFWQKNNKAFYGLAGVSSYVLFKEKNNYVTSVNGTTSNMFASYSKTSASFAGALSVSAGYEHTLPGNNALRMEPYITIPVKGMGMGNLPITTMGVRALFTIGSHR